MAQPDADPTDPHGLAIDAAQDVAKLAGMLESAGNQQAAAAMHKMADTLVDVAKQLSQGGQQQQAAPQGPPAAQPQAAQAAPAGPPAGPQTIAGAAGHLHQQMVASAQRRQAGL